MDFSRISFPVAYSEARSFLEREADIFTFLAHPYIGKAMEVSDPISKLKFITSGVVAGLHICMQSKKPWNPILGETYVAKWPNGTLIFGEQTSHHPPISNFQIHGVNDSWICSAECKFDISVGMFEVDVMQSGVLHLTLSDGVKYEFQFPNIAVFGIIRGDRIVRMMNPFLVKDVTNQLEAALTFNPKVDRSKGINVSTHTTLYGGIRKIGETEFISEMHGDYCLELVSEDVVLWNIENVRATRPAEAAHDLILPSDCRFRIDRSMLIQGKLEEAENAKIIMENAQRYDRALRSEGDSKGK